MTSGEVRKISVQDIQMVQILIERCVQLYMSEREVVKMLSHQAKIEPGFTEIVRRKLESENQGFFRAYHLRLIVKDQILRFNQLLERQVELMRQVGQTGVTSMSLSNESQITVTICHIRLLCIHLFLWIKTVQQPAGLATPTSYLAQITILYNLATQLKFPFHLSLVVIQTSSFGFLGQIPCNFSLSDLTADFSNSTDILESYSRSPFLGSGANFLDNKEATTRWADARRLDTVSEGLSYDDFARIESFE
ncbi:uncharacterized protein LOC121752688 [Salvia splendens]|uniref:uncharacterized protein LOC121752688 n=1 Tax=Salvia splendens TaxID=180675 RepID=UPI001C27E3EB|nr:uncharacterized protein LOC121752688 [Salvia splendens]